MIKILIDPIYSSSVWCENLKHSLVSELKKKRISFKFTDSCETLSADDSVFIISSDRDFTFNTIAILNSRNIQPILICNQNDALVGLNYSCVCSDIYGTIKSIFISLKQKGKKHPAMFGINKKSLSDMSRLESALHFGNEFPNGIQVFYNDGSVSNCFEQFEKDSDKFDSIVCANDFVAISFLRHAQESFGEKLHDLIIYSCAKSEISELYHGQFISPRTNYQDFGKAAVYIYEKTLKHKFMSNITIRICDPIDTGVSEHSAENPYQKDQLESDAFYKDPEIREMICIEKLLCNCDEIDRKIIRLMQENISHDDICSLCFLSANGLKYRIRRILTDCDFRDKKDLIDITLKYLPRDF